MTAVPELAGRGWSGVGAPLTLAGLHGRVVVVAFWSSRDVPSLRALEELRRLDHQHGEDVVVVAVHWPRAGEAVTPASLRAARARHRIGFPVLDDPDGATAAALGVVERPTLVLIDQHGSVLGRRQGEGHGASVGRAVTELLAAGRPPRRPLDLAPPGLVPHPLAFPTGVAASGDGTLVAIADTGHDRVVVATAGGLVLSVLTGFFHPTGVRFDGDRVVVCDAVGGRLVSGHGEVLADGIAWPTGLVAGGDGSWIVAEAGGHRLVRLQRDEISVRPVAGTGTRGAGDGPARRAELDQPAAVAVDATGVVFVDAGAGTLRRLLADRRDPEVVTLAGGLHHPRGVAARPDGATVYVADTMASALLAWEDGRWRALPVTGLDEPHGLDVLPDGRLLVADTNHHRVVLVDPEGGGVSEVVLDETWVHAGEGPPVQLRPGQAAPVDAAVDLVGEAATGPARVVARAHPAAQVAFEGIGQAEVQL